MEADSLFKTLTEHEGVEIILEWNSGLKIIGKSYKRVLKRQFRTLINEKSNTDENSDVTRKYHS